MKQFNVTEKGCLMNSITGRNVLEIFNKDGRVGWFFLC